MPHVLPQPTHDGLSERQFELTIRRLADSLSYGADASPYHGPGIDFAHSRLYVPGDPVKSIDWKVTGRTGKVFIREYEAPKRMPVYLVVDTSASMCASSHRLSKYACAVQVAGGLAMASLYRMSPVGVMACGERPLHVRPSLARSTIMQWLHHLRRFELTEQTQLAAGLTALDAALPERGLLIILSDLHDPDGLGAIKRVAHRQDVVVVEWRDPAEWGRLPGGIFRAREAESGAAFVGHGRTRFFDSMDHAARTLRRAGIDHIRLRTDQPIVAPLRQFLKHRHLVGQAAR